MDQETDVHKRSFVHIDQDDQIGEVQDAQIGAEVLQSLMNRGQKETEH